MLWVYVAEALLIVSIFIGFVSLWVMGGVGYDGGLTYFWTVLWRVILFGVLPISVICVFQIPNSMSNWAGPRLALQLLILLALICALACVASLSFLRDSSRSWLAKASPVVRVAVPILICLWADAVASAIPFMVRSSAHDLGWARFKVPDLVAIDTAQHVASEVVRLEGRRKLCATAVALIPKQDEVFPLVDLHPNRMKTSGQFAIPIPAGIEAAKSRFEYSYLTSRPTRETGPITHFSVLFYDETRRNWCDIVESGTSAWYNRGSVKTAELRRLFSWAESKAAADAQYWKETRTQPLEWAAIGILQEFGYAKIKIEPKDDRAEVLDTVLFWIKKLVQVGIIGLLVKGLADATKAIPPLPEDAGH
jgi:hypothetical protein